MTRTSLSRLAAVLLSVAMTVLLLMALVGCGGQAPTAAGTAKSSLALAQSRIATTAPDAKLLLVQTGNVVSATSTPVWTYLFGSPKTNTIYAVMIQNGTASGPMPYGNADLPAAEWAAIPTTTDAWKIDSDAAVAKAFAAAGSQGKSIPYAMGLVTYVPKNTTATIEPFVWSVVLNPQANGGAVPKTINVNATTGEAKVGK
jgi:hypothetical protein